MIIFYFFTLEEVVALPPRQLQSADGQVGRKEDFSSWLLLGGELGLVAFKNRLKAPAFQFFEEPLESSLLELKREV
jgi:hypothetical protein